MATYCGVDEFHATISCSVPGQVCAVSTASRDGGVFGPQCVSDGDTDRTLVRACTNSRCEFCGQDTLQCPGRAQWCATGLWFRRGTIYATDLFCANEPGGTTVLATYSPLTYGYWMTLGEASSTTESSSDPYSTSTRVEPSSETASTAHITPNPTASTSESRYISTSTSISDGNSPPAPVAMIVGVTVGVLAAILLAAGALFVVSVRKRKRTHYSRMLTTVLPESPGARPEQKPLMIDNPGVTELAADSSTMSSRIQLLHTPPQPTDDRLGHDFNSDGKTFSIESESTDTMSSLPPRPAIKRKAVSMLALGTAREGRAVSVMTDTSETLTMGGAGEVDDIHVIT